VNRIRQQRRRCGFCGRSFTLRPAGVSAGCRSSDRARAFAVLLGGLGLSLRQTAGALTALGAGMSKTTVDRLLQEAGVRANQLLGAARSGRVRLVGMDGTGGFQAGRQAGLVFIVDAQRRLLLAVEAAAETDQAAMQRLIQQVIGRWCPEAIRVDEHSVYLGSIPPTVRREVCLTHWQKSKGLRTRQLLAEANAQEDPAAVEALEQLRELLRQRPRPRDPPLGLERLVQRFDGFRAPRVAQSPSLGYRIKLLLMDVERTWRDVSAAADATNNATEQLIGQLFKIRAKTTRRYKSLARTLDRIHLADYLHRYRDNCLLAPLIA
jgi:hypothetical protein